MVKGYLIKMKAKWNVKSDYPTVSSEETWQSFSEVQLFLTPLTEAQSYLKEGIFFE